MRIPRMIASVAVIVGATAAVAAGTAAPALAATPVATSSTVHATVPPGCTLSGNYALLFCKRPAAIKATGTGGPSAKQILLCTLSIAYGARRADLAAAAVGCGLDIYLPNF